MQMTLTGTTIEVDKEIKPPKDRYPPQVIYDKGQMAITNDGVKSISDVKKEQELKGSCSKYDIDYCFSELSNSYMYDLRCWHEDERWTNDVWINPTRFISVEEMVDKISNGFCNNCGHGCYCIKLLLDGHKVEKQRIIEYMKKQMRGGVVSMKKGWISSKENWIKTATNNKLGISDRDKEIINGYDTYVKECELWLNQNGGLNVN